MITNQNFYTVQIGHLTRELPLFRVSDNLRIALFNLLGDTEVVVTAAAELVKKLPREVEVLITPEVKSVPLAFELSRVSGLPYVVARKICKPYMTGAISAEVESITTGQPQTLWLDGKDLAAIKGKKVAMIDDVVSTGSTFNGLARLVNAAGGQVAARVSIFTEGDSEQWAEVIALDHLPLFFDNEK